MLKPIVIFNQNIAESCNLAEIYRLHRNIPVDQMVGLDLKSTEASTISYPRFKSNIYSAMARTFCEKGWVVPGSMMEPDIPNDRQDVGWIVVCKGVPFKVWSQDADGRVTKFALDSYLGHTVYPSWQNGIAEVRYNPINPFVGTNKRREEFTNAPLAIVGRIDGPTYVDAQSMLEKSLQYEQVPLIMGDGIFDARGIPSTSPYFGQDQEIRDGAAYAKGLGLSTLLDNRNELIGQSFPSENAGFYVGWYNAAPQGPFHISRSHLPIVGWHIYSLAFNNLLTDWGAYFVRNGFVGSIGACYEPYMGSYPNIQKFIESYYVHNLSIGESFYNTPCHILNWMLFVLGDPLFRPSFVGMSGSQWDEINRQSQLLNNFSIATNGAADPSKCAAAMIKLLNSSASAQDQINGAKFVLAALQRDGSAATDYALKMAYWIWWMKDVPNRAAIMQEVIKIFGSRL